MTHRHSPRSWRWSNVPLPEVHLGLGVIGLVLHALLPRRIGWPPAVQRVGWSLVVAGVALAAWATGAAGGTDLARPDQLVTTGPYALSRNPMYAAWTLIYLGVAFVMRAAGLVALLPVLAVLIHRETGREEGQLVAAFGSEYEAYRAQVRRYL